MNTLLASIPVICFLTIFLNTKSRTEWREAFLFSAVIWGVFVVFITETLSVFRLINFWSILILWGIATIVSIILLIKNRAALTSNLDFSQLKFSPLETVLLISTTLIVLTTFVIAWVSPPNTWDSMTYHMSRVMHWIQNRSVEFYPTNILRQLHLSPGSEYIIMQFQILKGNDGFANLVQWFSMVGSLIGVSLIAKALGANQRGQIFSAMIAATIPMGIFQATSTQNDYVVAFWLVCFYYFAMKFKNNTRWQYTLLTGASLGLATLTKATAYLFAFPFLLYITYFIIKPIKEKHYGLAIRSLALIASVVIIINAPIYLRNFNFFGNPLGPQTEGVHGTKYANDIFTPSALASNLVRNVAMHFGTHYYSINLQIEKYVYDFHDLLGISPNDPRTTWQESEFHINYPMMFDGLVQNFYHTWLILFALPIIVLQKFDKKDDVHSYLGSLVLAFVLFALYLRWQAWHSRLQLPLFVLWSAVLGLTLARLRLQWVANIVILALVFSAYTPTTQNLSRPLIGKRNIFNTDRIEQYFSANPSILTSYIETQNYFDHHSCSKIGLITDADGWEYPFWVLLTQNGKKNVQIEHVLASNVSATKTSLPSYIQFVPCAIITTNISGDSLAYRGEKYHLVQQEKNVNIYVR